MSHERAKPLLSPPLPGLRAAVRGSVVACLLLLVACGDTHPAAAHKSKSADRGDAAEEDGGRAKDGGGGSDASHPMPKIASSDANVMFTRADQVDFSIGRSELWSWTTTAQAAALRAHPALLGAPESDAAQAKLTEVINALADTGDPLALVLSGGAFQKQRGAWPNAWAVLRTTTGEPAGDQLLRIVLKPEALFATLDSSTLQVLDMQNQLVQVAEALGAPERIAAIYYVNQGDAGRDACSGNPQGCAIGAFRQYFIVSEAMVQEWSLGTQAILDEIERGVALLQALRDAIGPGGAGSDRCEFSRFALCHWGTGGKPYGTYDAYVGGVARTQAIYALTPPNMDSLAKELAATRFELDPFVHMP
jgi:hypothetical protein